MELQDLYAIVVTDELEATRDFYVDHFGFGVVFETDWFVYVGTRDGRSFGVAFMKGGLQHQHQAHRKPYDASSLILTLQVEDARLAYDRVVKSGLDPEIGLRDEPFGQRHFMTRDPAGVWVDVVQQIEPDPSFVGQAEQERLESAITRAANRTG